MKKNFRNYFALALTLGAITIAGNGLSVNAQTAANAGTTTVQNTEMARPMRMMHMGLNTESLVEKGIINQETADKIQEFMKKEMPQPDENVKFEIKVNTEMTEEEKAIMKEARALKGEEIKATHMTKVVVEERFDIVQKLVDENIITSEQGEKIREEMPKMTMSFGFLNTDQLIKDGKLSQETADRINAYMESKRAEMDAKFEEMKDTVKAERAEKLDVTIKFNENIEKGQKFEKTEEMHKLTRVDMVDELLNEGIITADEAKVLREYMDTILENTSVTIKFEASEAKTAAEQ